MSFVPTGEIKTGQNGRTGWRSVYADMKMIPKGSILYKIYGMDGPKESNGKNHYIGDIVLKATMNDGRW